MKDQRRSLRFKTHGLVHAKYGGRQFSVDNLSTIGALIRTVSPLALGTEVELDLVSDRLSEPIELTTVVCHSKLGEMGVQFTQFHRLAKFRLEELLSALSSETEQNRDKQSKREKKS